MFDGPAFHLGPPDGAQPGGDQLVGLLGEPVTGCLYLRRVLDQERDDRGSDDGIGGACVAEPLGYQPQDAVQQDAAWLKEIMSAFPYDALGGACGQGGLPRQVGPAVAERGGHGVELPLQVPHAPRQAGTARPGIDQHALAGHPGCPQRPPGSPGLPQDIEPVTGEQHGQREVTHHVTGELIASPEREARPGGQQQAVRPQRRQGARVSRHRYPGRTAACQVPPRQADHCLVPPVRGRSAG